MTALEYFNGDELAANVWQSKYAMEGEQTPEDMHRRLAKEFYRIEKKYQDSGDEFYPKNSLSKYGKTRKPLEEEDIFNLFKDFKYIVPQGSVMSVIGTGKIASSSNCFVIGQPEDSYGGILRKDEELVQLMKRRGGVGIDISSLRPQGVRVTNSAGSSTGAVSFMERFSNSTREVSQNGRRGALMISLDIRHPDIENFITIKQDLTKVTGANVSILLRDEFMQAVEEDKDYILRWPIDSKDHEILYDTTTLEYNKLLEIKNLYSSTYIKKVRAKELWSLIIGCAWNSAEPGLMFLDRHWNYSPDSTYSKYKGVTSNPCSEIFMSAFDACRLIAINLFNFVENPFTSNAYFNFKKFYEYCYEQQRLADDLIDLELERIEAILKKIDQDIESDEVKLREKQLWLKIKDMTESSRRTGCGFTALGDTLAALDYKYDSNAALVFINGMMRTKMKAELDCTIDLAILRGTFKGWNLYKEFDVSDSGYTNGKNAFYEMLWKEFPEQCERMFEYGRRNVSWSTTAPTGSVSLLTQTTSGLEPLFMPYYMRRKKINPSDQNNRVDFVDEKGDSWMEFPVIHPKFKEWYNKQDNSDPNSFMYGVAHRTLETYNTSELDYLFQQSPWYGSTANEIDWIKRIDIQSMIQDYTTHSISSTINLPNSVTKEEVADIYLTAWKAGLKGITIYRDGCRTGVLVSKKEDSFEYKDAPKRPKELPCSVDTVRVKGQPFTVLVGLLDGKPYEVFAIPFEVMKGYDSGILAKKGKGKYNLICNLDEEINITSEMTEEQETITRLISAGLRHGTNVKFICEQLLKTEGELNSFTKAIARVLKKHIPDGEKSTVSCNECGSTEVVFQEGCLRCNQCGNSKCG